MEVITQTITLENPEEPLYIVPIGDIHYGNINCDVKKLKDTIDYIKNKKNCYAVLMGDLADAVLLNDKRFDFNAITPELRGKIDSLALSQYENLKEMLLPIKEKILVGLTGNHDETLRLKHNTDFAAWLYKELEVPFGGYTCFLEVKFDRSQFHTETVTFFLHHGFMSSKKTGGKVNAVEDLASSFDADVYCVGHSHDLFVTSRVKLSVAGTKIKERKMYFAQTGTFLKTYAQGSINYGEKSCYPPLKTGVVKFTLIPSSKGVDIHASE